MVAKRRPRVLVTLLVPLLFGLLLLHLGGCKRSTSGSGEGLSGRIKIDGSSTVFPVTEAVAEEFQKKERRVQVTVGVSGTGGGFEKFTRGEIDIVNASRPVKDHEKKIAADNNLDYVELEIALDGLSVVVSRANDFVESLTVNELKKIWETESAVAEWKDIRSEWPAERIKLFGPGTDSGTFDYFTEAIVGREGASRSDYTASEDDNVLVDGVASTDNSLGYFGYAYYSENKGRLKVVGVDNGDGPVEPTVETIRSGKYAPLSRPLLIYVRADALKRPEARAFVEFYLEQAASLAEEVGYVPLPDADYREQLEDL
ncbi:MAG: PstS family phosphate ABC transporter substrate-binding protein [Terriglobia bacterium]